jgi:transcription elongation factor SPT5
VELHSRLKKVMVLRERVIVVGDKFGATENPNQNGPVGVVMAPHAAMATPMHALGGATPAIHSFGGATPSHGDSEATDEVWRPGGSVDEAIKEDDGWGTAQNDLSDANVNEDNDGGWGSGSANASSWGTPAHKKEEEGRTFVQPKEEDISQPSGVIKREAMKSEVETEVADSDETPVWFMERVCVQIKESDQLAVIKEVNPDKSALVEMPDLSTQTFRVSEISMVPPVEHDTVLVTGGNEVGLEGSLVCVDGESITLVPLRRNIFAFYSSRHADLN